MKFLKFKFFILSVFLLIGCEKSDFNTNTSDFNTDRIDFNIVSKDNAIEIAEKIELSKETFLKSSSIKKKVLNVDIVFEEQVPLYYIINYDKGAGFIVISADKRCLPILAYSEKGSFNRENISGGLIGWMERSKSYVKMMKADTSTFFTINKKLWKELDYRIADPGEPDPEELPAEPVVTEVGPLLTTTWGQGCGYNALCPSVSSGGACGHAYAGCTTIALAQIMNYHQHPSNYNWEGMPDLAHSNDIAVLIRDIGDAIGVHWGFDGKGTGLYPDEQEDNIPPALINTFNYGSSVEYIEYFGNHDRVVQELNWGRPVYMRGGVKKYWLGIIPYYGGGHAWVCDGYRRYRYPTLSYLYLQMNWGWNNTSNGWFAFNNFNPMANGEEQDFNYKVGCIVGIKP